MKVINSNHINPFGGINFVFDSFDKLGIDKLVEQHLPQLPTWCIYNWKDIFYSFWSIYFCGGDCIEDIGINLKQHLHNSKHINIPSPDRIIDRLKSLSEPTINFTIDNRPAQHYFSLNEKLNALLICLAKQTRLLNGDELTLDYDNTIIPTNKADSKKTYKKCYGYQPGVAFVNNSIVYVENRNGNSQAQTSQHESLARMFAELKAQQIKIHRYRADGASYQLKVIQLVEKKTDYFYIRAAKSITISKLISQIRDWEEVDLNGSKAYRTEIAYKPFKGKVARINGLKEQDLKTYRLIITKTKRKDGQIDLYTNEACIYRCIITNDFEMDQNEVVEFYNQRGAVEKQFDILKNDFGWKNLSFSKLAHNTVFLLLTAMCKNLYEYIIRQYATKYKYLNANFRIKKFIFRFICFPAMWIQ